MVQGIQNIQNINSYFPSERKANYTQSEPFHSFEREDEAIISAQAKLLNELDKYNSGNGNEIDLAITSITSKNQVAAEARVIQTKKDMLDTILDSF